MADLYRDQEVEDVDELAPVTGVVGTAPADGMGAEQSGVGDPPTPVPAGPAEHAQAGPLEVPEAGVRVEGGSSTPPLGFISSSVNPIPQPGP